MSSSAAGRYSTCYIRFQNLILHHLLLSLVFCLGFLFVFFFIFSSNNQWHSIQTRENIQSSVFNASLFLCIFSGCLYNNSIFLFFFLFFFLQMINIWWHQLIIQTKFFKSIHKLVFKVILFRILDSGWEIFTSVISILQLQENPNSHTISLEDR